MKGRETYQDLLDSHVVEEWELWDECKAVIKSPEDDDELVYNLENPGRLEDQALATVSPEFWADYLNWELHEIPGSKLDPPPEKAKGTELDFIYTNLPKNNSAFTLDGEIKARFSDRARQAGCQDPAALDVAYYFPRGATNNPGPAVKAKGNEEKEPDPNWFYYWGQTAAAQGRSAKLRYGGRSERCVPKPKTKTEKIAGGGEVTNVYQEKIYGYSHPADPYVVICDLSILNFRSSHLFVPRLTTGIDVYAVTVAHEFTHYDNRNEWWPYGYNGALDKDGDEIPDSKEGKKGIKIPAPLNKRYTYFDPDDPDTPNRGQTDDEYLAWMAELKWKIRSADTEDWSCPGHQTVKCGK